MKFFVLFWATGFGIGYLPIAPGTWATLLAIPMESFLSKIPSPFYELTLLTLFFLSSRISEKAESLFGRRDDPRIVIDEMLGFFITLLWIPKTPLSMGVGFLLFRFFDILKPFPIRYLEKRLKGGYGVVMDDIVAGAYGNVLLRVGISLPLLS